MDDRQAFKFGFMLKCIDNGLTTPGEMLTAVKQAEAALDAPVKQAEGPMSMLGSAWNGATGLANTALSWGIPLALAAPPLLGAGIGHLAAKAQDISDQDVDEAKNNELIEAYGREAARSRREGVIRRQTKPKSITGRPMF